MAFTSAHSRSFPFKLDEGDSAYVELNVDLRFLAGGRLESAEGIERPQRHVFDGEIRGLCLERKQNLLQRRGRSKELHADDDLAEPAFVPGALVLAGRDAAAIRN